MAVQDLQQGVRLLWRSPGFTLTAVITLALGIGATTAIFSAVNAVLLNPFPYADPARIMQIMEHGKDPNDSWGVSYPNYLDWKKQQTSFEAIAAVHSTELTVTGRGEPVRVRACAFSASAVTLLGVPPLLGRGFREDEDREGAPRVALVGHRFWQERLDADPHVVGRTLSLDNQPYTIVGVMPPRFAFYGADVWVPIGLNFVGEVLYSRVAHPNGVIARLAPGVTLEQARAEMRVIARRLAAAYPDTNGDMSARVDPLLDRVVSGIKPTLLVLLGAVTFLLLVACANVANLLLARAATRRKEMAVRLALGASRTRLFRQVIVECIPLAGLGAAAGLFLAYAITQAVVALLPAGSIPAEASIRIDGRVLLFSLALSLGATIVCASVGALPRSVRNSTALKDESRSATGGRERRRIGHALVVIEIALSLMLVAGAGLLIGSFYRLQQVSPGFTTNNVLRVQLTLPSTRYATSEQADAFYSDVLERFQRLPGVRAVGATSNAPFSGSGEGMPFVREGSHYDSLQAVPNVQYSLVRGQYFRAMGIALRRGRVFDERDRAQSAAVVVVNETAVRRHFAGKDPLGQRVMLGIPDNLNREGLLPKGISAFPWATVVGVVSDTRRWALNSEPQPEAYVPFAQGIKLPFFTHVQFFALQTAAAPAAIASAVREQVWAVDRDQPIAGLMTLDEAVTGTLRQPRFSMLVLMAFASTAMLLAAIGIYGVMSYSVVQRTREVGIRMALGAEARDVLGTLMAEGLRLAIAGVVLGVIGALLMSRLLSTMLFQISPTDPVTFVSVATVLAAVALLACYVPARRATRVPPLTALLQSE
jgi:putative ABC transport system permease protein